MRRSNKGRSIKVGTVGYLCDFVVLSDFTLLCGIDSEPRRLGAPSTGHVEDAISIKWISDRVFNQGAGVKKKKKKQSTTIPSYTDPCS